MTSNPVFQSIRHLWRQVGLDEAFVSSTNLILKGEPDTVVPSSFKVGHLAQASIALSGLAASLLYGYRNETSPPKVEIEARHALLNFIGEAYTLIDGKVPKDVWDDLAGLYATQDGHVRIHTNFPHHRDGILNLLQCAPTRAAIADALKTRSRDSFEQEATAAGMCVAALRTFTEWDSHPQGIALRSRPPVELIKIGDSPPRMGSRAPRPLGAIKVLELTRVIAGPVAGRVLADFGADVLWITSPQLPSLPMVDIDTSRGKRATQLDLTQTENVKTLRELVSHADVFLQSYRPDSMENRGFGTKELVGLRPGIIVANLRGYGWEGPWAEKRAFDSLVQAASGFNLAEGDAWARHEGKGVSSANIKVLPVQCLDHGAGQLLAFGIMAALYRSMTEGGSWEVRVSLAGVGQWLRDLGQLEPQDAFKGKQLPQRTASVDIELRNLVQEWKVRRGSSKTIPKTLVALKSAVSLDGVFVGSSQVPGSLTCDSAAWESTAEVSD